MERYEVWTAAGCVEKPLENLGSNIEASVDVVEGCVGASWGLCAGRDGGFLEPLSDLLGASWGLGWASGGEGLDVRLAPPMLGGTSWGRLRAVLSRRGRLWRRLPTLFGRLGAHLEAS